MPLVRVGSLAQLPPGCVMEATVNGKTYAVCNVGGELHALDGVCPHREGPLGNGALHGKMLVCPWHAWEYDCTTGENDYNPSIRLEKFAVRVEGDDIVLNTA